MRQLIFICCDLSSCDPYMSYYGGPMKLLDQWFLTFLHDLFDPVLLLLDSQIWTHLGCTYTLSLYSYISMYQELYIRE